MASKAKNQVAPKPSPSPFPSKGKPNFPVNRNGWGDTALHIVVKSRKTQTGKAKTAKAKPAPNNYGGVQ